MNIFKNDILRGIIFLFGCIGTRTLLALFIASKYNIYSRLLSLVLLTIGLGFLTIYIGGFRETGQEVGGGKIWWNVLRPIHGVLYILAAYFLYNKSENISANIILIDTLIGLIAWIYKRII